jgi:hypothetical protein
VKLWQYFQFPYVFSSRLILGICLADDTFGNSISSSFVRYCLWMAVGRQLKPYKSPRRTPCPEWSTGRIAMSLAIRLIGHKSGQTNFDSESLK